jgi:DNA-binding PadR family transcriptional regulator
MEQLTPTGRVVLGMLSLGKRTGYDIKQLVDVSTRFFWAASYGQIYPELKRLEAQGLVESSPQPTGGRARTEYSLTPAGQRALDEWLASPLQPGFQMRDEGMLKLFFSDGRDTEEVLATLRAMRTQHERALARLQEAHPTPDQPDPGPYLTLEYGLGLHEWVIDWCRQTERRLERSATSASRRGGGKRA